jgi:hypothetical protein
VRCPDLRRFACATEYLRGQVSAAFYHSDEAIFEGIFDQIGYAGRVLAPGPSVAHDPATAARSLSHPKFGLFTHGDTERLLKDMGLTPDRDYAIIEPGIDLELDATPKERRLVRGKLNVLRYAACRRAGSPARLRVYQQSRWHACIALLLACFSPVPKRDSRRSPTSMPTLQSHPRPVKVDDIPVSTVELHGKMNVEGPTAWKARRRQPFGRRRRSRGQLT